MNQETKAKGISLIVLVITIIIIIILAGAVILSLSNSGIISKAKLAKESNDLVAIREAVETEKSNVMLSGGTVNVTIPAAYSDDVYVSPIGGIFLKPNANSKITDVANALDKLGAAYLPTGFEHLEGTLDEGIVIKNIADGNEFVWIPVPDITKFYLVGDFTTFTENVPADTSYTSLIGEPEGVLMKASVTTYKGFYIARYEAGKVGTTAVSKPTQTVYNNISWTDSVTKAKAMYTGTTAGSPVSTLVYGEQWDAAMRYMKDVPNNITPANKYITDSTGMGEYTTYDGNWEPIVQGSLQQTGSKQAYKVKNIYDMAGNVWEWTTEAYDTDYCVIRGGYFNFGGAYNPASYRNGHIPDNCDGDVGFRSALYIK